MEKCNPQNLPSVWPGVLKSQTLTPSAVQKDTKIISSTAQNQTEDEMDVFQGLIRLIIEI